eukprot:CAMPEP_0167757372 /NCGR_PEP_ID=MMETSP0110_2-20121227/9887_1 /TAXON_ID=629695 /ORGANISM="Gymnochlora sp., Strain CCMP2014" /LENGTH=370 /DNA_ID=CAMNT_0007643551 /DNA_START=351 /DNA_END=1459 /DNA_ORIENTATION=-
MSCFVLLAVLPPSIGMVTFLTTFITLGQMTTGVMCDTLIVENMRHETSENRGKLQTECWVLMTLAGIGGILGGGFVYLIPGMTNSRVFMLNAVLKLLVLPFAVWLHEAPCEPSSEPASQRVQQRASEVWEALKGKCVWQPTLFVFLFSVFPNPGIAMTNFFINELGFGEEELSYISVVASLSGAAGMLAYYKYFKEFNWHYFFAGVVCLASALSLTQLILVFHINRDWGIPDLAFALGDDAIVDVTNALLAMPILILVASICPSGVESSLYAFVTSIQAAGGTVGGSISAILIGAFGIEMHNYERLWQLVLVCSLAKLLILPAIPMLPISLGNVSSGGPKSWQGAALLITLLILGIGWALGQASYKVAVS